MAAKFNGRPRIKFVTARVILESFELNCTRLDITLHELNIILAWHDRLLYSYGYTGQKTYDFNDYRTALGFNFALNVAI